MGADHKAVRFRPRHSERLKPERNKNHDQTAMSFAKDIPKFSFNFTRPDPNVDQNREPAMIETSLLGQLVLSRRHYLEAIDDEIAATSSLSASLQTEITEMEAKMDEKRSMLALLNKALVASHENREKVLRDIMTLSNVLPVARRLPDEILVRLFTDAVEMEEDERRREALEWRSYSLGRAPLTISGVCRRWRNIAIGTPSLWRFVNLVSGSDESSSVLPVFEHWCKYGITERAEISLDGWKKDHHSPLPALITAVTTRQRPTLRRIEISCIDHRASFNADWPFVYPLAEEVVLISNSADGICDFFIPLVSRAQKVVLSGIKVWWSDSTWDNLTDLTITGLPNYRLPPLRSSDVLEMFTMAPKLSKLDVAWDHTRTETSAVETGPPSLTHGDFRSLTCPFEAIETYLSPFQKDILCPALQELTFKTLPFITPPLLRGWTAFFNSVTPFPLHHLQLPSIHHDAIDHLLFLFGLLPCLERLTLTGEAVDALLHRLTTNSQMNRTDLLPSLINLYLRDTDVTDETLRLLVWERVASNNSGRATKKIAEIVIYECPGISSQGWEGIRTLLNGANP